MNKRFEPGAYLPKTWGVSIATTGPLHIVLLEKMKDEVIALPRSVRVSQRSAPRFFGSCCDRTEDGRLTLVQATGCAVTSSEGAIDFDTCSPNYSKQSVAPNALKFFCNCKQHTQLSMPYVYLLTALVLNVL